MAWTQSPLQQTCPCNGELLRFFRERLGYSLQELADVAGCSESLVGTAEPGQAISIDVIDDLATALSTPEETLYPEDLISDPLALAKEYRAAIYSKHHNPFEAIRYFLDEEVVFWFAGDPQEIPFAGKHQGLAEIEELFQLFFSLLEPPQGHDFEPCFSYLAQGNVVIVMGESWIHPIGTPLDKPLNVTIRMTFRKGKLILLEDAYDAQSGAKLLQAHRLNSPEK